MAAAGPAHERAHVFVAMPFDPAYDPLYQVIEDEVRRVGLKPLRADAIAKSEAIIENILNAIEQAGLVIGVTAGANFNVAYELGFAKHLNKELILMTDDASTIPADIMPINHLLYATNELGSAAGKLREWLQNTRFVSEEARNTILRRGEVFETVVDGTFYLQKIRPMPSKEEIKEYLTFGTSMPQRLLYLTEEGQTTYLNLCNDPTYGYYRETTHYINSNVVKLVDKALDHSNANEVDFISLGSGNGHKDATFLDELARRAQDLRYTYYYPYDVSGGLLLEAMRNILARSLPLEKLRVKAIEADLAFLPEFKRVFDYRPQPNVYSLLGGLANTERGEVDLLRRLHRMMAQQDCLFLEIRRKRDEKVAALGDENLNRRLDLAPLRYVGARVDPSTVHYDPVPSTSTIPNTRTIAAVVPKLELDRSTYEEVNLFSVHYYDADAVETTLHEVGFRIIHNAEQPNSLFYICVPK